MRQVQFNHSQEENYDQPWNTVSSKKNQTQTIELLLKDKAKRMKISEEKIEIDKLSKILNCQNKIFDTKIKVNKQVEENKCFKWGNVEFEVMENETIKCGFSQT